MKIQKKKKKMMKKYIVKYMELMKEMFLKELVLLNQRIKNLKSLKLKQNQKNQKKLLEIIKREVLGHQLILKINWGILNVLPMIKRKILKKVQGQIE